MSKVKNLNLRRKYSQKIPSNSYLTHGIHSYTAKLIPQIPRYFIERYTQENDALLDPFCGSGTALLESILLSRNGIGIDINPLATLISKVKTKRVSIDELSLAISLIKKELLSNDNASTVIKFPNIDYWFGKKAQDELSRIRYVIDKLSATNKFSEDINSFLLVCLSSIIRKSSYADPRMAKTYKSKRVIRKIENGWSPTPIKYFEDALDRNFEKMKGLLEYLNSNNYAEVFQGDAREAKLILRKNGIGEVDSIITSPPYINAQDYFRSYKLELWWLGLATPEETLCLKRQAIGTENTFGIDYNSTLKNEIQLLNKVCNAISEIDKTKSAIVYKYFQNMKLVFNQCNSVLKKDGYFCLITGNNTICGIHVPTCKILSHIAETAGFNVLERGRDKIKDRALPPGRNHDGGIIGEEWITVFKKVRE